MGTTASPDATTAPDREVLTWEGFGDASRELTQQIVDSGWIPDLIVAIARGGLIPAGAIAYAMDVKAIGTMNVEFYSGIGETLEEPLLLPPEPGRRDGPPGRVGRDLGQAVDACACWA